MMVDVCVWTFVCLLIMNGSLYFSFGLVSH